MTNLVIYTENYYYGGLERFLFDLLKNKNFNFEIIANSGNSRIVNFAQENNIKYKLVDIKKIDIELFSNNKLMIFFQKKLNFILSYILMLPNYFKIKQELKTLVQYENILIINGGYPAALSCLCAAMAAEKVGFKKIGMSILSCPVNTYRKKIFFFIQNILDKVLHKCVDFYIPNAEIIKKELVDYAKFNPSQIYTVYTGVEIPQATKKSRVLNYKNNQIVKMQGDVWVGMVALLGSTKRQDIIIEAMASLKTRAPQIKCLIVGDGPNMDLLLQKANVLKIQDHVFFTGWLESIESAYDFIDICVFASNHEGLPYAISEAMSHKIPVIASSVGGIPEQIEDGASGLLFCNDNINDIVDKIIYLSNNSNIRERYAEASFLKAKKYFSIDSMNKRLEDLYK